MEQIWNFFLVLGVLCSLCACSQQAGGESTSGWQEQYDLGIRYLSEGNYEEAIIAFTSAIEIDPKRAPAYVGRGDAYVLSGETEDNLTAAQADYKTAIELDELLAEAYLGLAEVFIRRGDKEAARAVLEQGLEATGDSALQDRLDELVGTENQNSGILSKAALTSGTLELSDFQAYFEDSGGIMEYNEGAVGGMSLSFTVNGPAEITDVLIASWYTDTPPLRKLSRNRLTLLSLSGKRSTLSPRTEISPLQ